ncbi:MAG: cation:proton antiporter [Microbacteriaceae bacterium]
MGEELVVLGALFLIAWGLGRLGKLIGIPAIPIYMIIGLLASPHVGWFPLDFESADVELVATIGLILLLFNLGLEFDQDEFFGNAKTLIVTGGTRLAINLATSFGFGMLVGWGTREAIVIAGMMATSSSAIVTKLLIELRRLANRETPIVLGIAVIEDVFVAIYLSIVSVVVSGETRVWPIVLELSVAFTFLIVMFAAARWGGRLVSRVFQTRDDELFTVMFFGLAVAFGGIGDLLGVSDAIGAFLIGLVLGASRFRDRVEALALPMRDIFGAFFFLNFGLALDPSTFGTVLLPVVLAVALTLSVNTLGGQLLAWQGGLSRAEGFNVSAMLQTRGEFALILAALATEGAAGLDERLVPFAGLYVLTMAIVGPILAVNSERAGERIFRRAPATAPVSEQRHRIEEENIALVEAALAGEAAPVESADAAEEDATERPRDPEY